MNYLLQCFPEGSSKGALKKVVACLHYAHAYFALLTLTYMHLPQLPAYMLALLLACLYTTCLPYTNLLN